LQAPPMQQQPPLAQAAAPHPQAAPRAQQQQPARAPSEPLPSITNYDVTELVGKGANVRAGRPVRLGHPRHDHPGAVELDQAAGHRSRVGAQAPDAFVRGDRLEVVVVEHPLQLGRGGLGKARELDGAISSRGDGMQCPRQILGRETAERVKLERDLVRSHPGTIGQRHGRRAPTIADTVASRP